MGPLSVLVVALIPPLAAAAPRTDELPKGALAQLRPTESPAKSDARPAGVNALAFLDDRTLFVGTNAGWQTWDVQKRSPRQDRPVARPAFAAFRYADRVLVGSARKVHVIEPLQSGNVEPARSWPSAADSVTVLAVAPAGGRLVYADGEKTLAVVDVRTGKMTGVAEFASQPVAASLTANGRVLAIVTRDGIARGYSLHGSGAVEALWTKRVARNERVGAQFSRDGRLFAVSSAGRVLILDAVTGRPMQALERRFGEGDVRCLDFSPDGRQVAIGGNGPDAIVRVSDVVTASEQATFTGHAGDVNVVAFSPDGRILASGGADQSVLLWKVPGAKPGPSLPTTAQAWEALDSLDTDIAYQSMGALLADPGRAVAVIGDGFRGVAGEQAKIRRWIAELDHDEFRVREAARASILRTGLRAAAALNDPARKKMGVEGENRVRLILEAMESQGLRVPESGLFGEPLRTVRGVRVLESIGGPAARAVLEEVAKGPADPRLMKEARAALEVFPTGR